MPFDRKVFFDAVRVSLFGGHMTQQQVDGMDAVLSMWELVQEPIGEDRRWLGYELATTYHETAKTMWPIEEYGKGKGQPYGKPDPETEKTYYGRGFVQLTWKDNYVKMGDKLGVDLKWQPELALEISVAAQVMFVGMNEGLFRPPNSNGKFFNQSVEDPFNARDIINGDKNVVPSWANGQKLGRVIEGYYDNFMHALEASWKRPPGPEPPLKEREVVVIVPDGISVRVVRHGEME